MEWKLSELIEHPHGAGTAPPDFTALRQRVLSALEDRPFECDRTIPENDVEALNAMRRINNGSYKFTSKEIEQIRAVLRGADLPAWIYPDPQPLILSEPCRIYGAPGLFGAPQSN